MSVETHSLQLKAKSDNSLPLEYLYAKNRNTSQHQPPLIEPWRRKVEVYIKKEIYRHLAVEPVWHRNEIVELY